MLKALYNKLKFRQPYIEENFVIENPEAFKWDQEADLVVAGFGGAGAAAALEAKEQGLDTLVLDRFNGGGSTVISGGIFYAGGGTSIQQQAGVEDTPENMFNYLKQEVQGAVSDTTLQRFCNESVDNFNWLQKNGVPFEASFCPFKTSYPPNQYYFYYSGNESFAPYSDNATPAARGHRARQPGVSGAAIFEPLRASAKKQGIRIQTQSKVVALLTNVAGDVIGLKAIQLKSNFLARCCHKLLAFLHIMTRYNGLYWPPLFQVFAILTEWLERNAGTANYIKAKKGVVLATGGFYGNQSMVKQYAPNFVGGSPLGTLADDGSGIQMAMRLGAQTALMDSVSAWRFINPPTSFVKGVLVGPSGKRVCNEMLYGAQVGERMMREHDGKAYVILDHATYQAAFKDLNLKKGLWFHVLLGGFYLLLGCKKAHSIRGLATKLGIDSEALHDTISEYNQIAKSDDKDPMGKPKEYMPAIGDGPYHAVNVSYDYYFVSCPSLTLGGLQVNEETGRVLKEDGKEIIGLYAAGRTAVGIPSRGYVSGLSIADCVFSGRRAAKHSAQQ
jgi:3-oxo-5alpha-steroid 4-dehydrogenase